MLIKQCRLILTALAFLTRIPIPAWVGYSDAQLNAAVRYFPLIGWLVGALAAGVYSLSVLLWSPAIAVLLSMVFTLLLTGAFHEDGLADFYDGVYGGLTVARRLEIMKDSRVGTYGVLALLAVLGLKFAALSSMTMTQLPWVLIAGHSLSRAFAVSFIYSHDYARSEGGKVQVVAQGLRLPALIFALLVGCLPLYGLPLSALWALPALLVLRVWFARTLTKQLGGYTGDALGAAQQLSELVFYLVVSARL
ncbi:MAG: adenosylcobinamide-GDP ribazoletransferase [Sulfuriferula sp.]|nr:adenosylcobinamide-GDP ribazoletransferase [Sulfuriferula sp.]